MRPHSSIPRRRPLFGIPSMLQQHVLWLANGVDQHAELAIGDAGLWRLCSDAPHAGHPSTVRCGKRHRANHKRRHRHHAACCWCACSVCALHPTSLAPQASLGSSQPWACSPQKKTRPTAPSTSASSSSCSGQSPSHFLAPASRHRCVSKPSCVSSSRFPLAAPPPMSSKPCTDSQLSGVPRRYQRVLQMMMMMVVVVVMMRRRRL